jgi:hypothetical protein
MRKLLEPKSTAANIHSSQLTNDEFPRSTTFDDLHVPHKPPYNPPYKPLYNPPNKPLYKPLWLQSHASIQRRNLQLTAIMPSRRFERAQERSEAAFFGITGVQVLYRTPKRTIAN